MDEFSKEICADMQQRYDRGDVHRLSDLLESFHSLKQGSLSIDEYHTKLKILWDEILMFRPIPICVCDPQPACTCNVLKNRENVYSKKVLKFIKSLNDSFELVRSLVLMIVSLPDMNIMFNISINHER